MKLFISWSGEFSRKVAECLSIWIPTIIQAVDVFYSPDDIAKGENWGNRLSEELEQSNFGIVCLTPENVLAPWIHFEAGALSKASNSRVSAIMLGINPSDIKGPLARLQNTSFDRDDFHRLFQSINECSEKPLRADILDNAFNNSWENLMGDIAPIIESYSSQTLVFKAEIISREEHHSDSEAIQEILRLVRNWDTRREAPVPNLALPSISDCDDSKLIFFRCPERYIESALPIIRKYTVSSQLAMQDIERKLKTQRKVLVYIPTDLVSNFKIEMNAHVPESTIIP